MRFSTVLFRALELAKVFQLDRRKREGGKRVSKMRFVGEFGCKTAGVVNQVMQRMLRLREKDPGIAWELSSALSPSFSFRFIEISILHLKLAL